MERAIDLFRAWLAWLLFAAGLVKRPRFLMRFSERHPNVEELDDDDFVVVKSGEILKWACFRCPCGCGEKIALSLAVNRRPSWTITSDWLNRPTVQPSVWQLAGCHSHYWIKRGSVEWCATATAAGLGRAAMTDMTQQ